MMMWGLREAHNHNNNDECQGLTHSLFPSLSPFRQRGPYFGDCIFKFTCCIPPICIHPSKPIRILPCRVLIALALAMCMSLVIPNHQVMPSWSE